MAVAIRNAISDTCDKCGKRVVYEKDEDSGLASIETKPMVWEQLCEECAEEHYAREKRYRDEDEAGRPDAAVILSDRRDSDGLETQTGYADLGGAFADARHVIHSGGTFVNIRAGDRILYDENSILPIMERIAAIYQDGAGESLEEAARRVAAEEPALAV